LKKTEFIKKIVILLAIQMFGFEVEDGFYQKLKKFGL
jgi:hypothetical protein